MKYNILVEAYLHSVKSLKQLVRGLMRNDDDHEDILHEAFCRLWTAKQDYKDEREAMMIMTRTVRNICIDQLRRNKVVQFKPLEMDLQDSFADNFEVQDEFEKVQQIIEEELSATARQVLRMRDYEGYEIEEIAMQLGMKNVAVRMTLSRARKKIREQYNRRNQ